MTNKNLIVAHDLNRVIGYQGDMPWRGKLPADLKRFKELTTGCAIIMGHDTYKSIGIPLPNRRNIVLSRQTDLTIDGCEVAASYEEALDLASDEVEIFIIGGSKVYHIAMPTADRLYVTEIEAEFEGDTFFPELPPQWQEISRETCNADAVNQFNYSFVVYERIS